MFGEPGQPGQLEFLRISGFLLFCVFSVWVWFEVLRSPNDSYYFLPGFIPPWNYLPLIPSVLLPKRLIHLLAYPKVGIRNVYEF